MVHWSRARHPNANQQTSTTKISNQSLVTSQIKPCPKKSKSHIKSSRRREQLTLATLKSSAIQTLAPIFNNYNRQHPKAQSPSKELPSTLVKAPRQPCTNLWLCWIVSNPSKFKKDNWANSQVKSPKAMDHANPQSKKESFKNPISHQQARSE